MNLAEYENVDATERFELDRRLCKRNVYIKKGTTLAGYIIGGINKTFTIVDIKTMKVLGKNQDRLDRMIDGIRFQGTVESLVGIIFRENGLYRDRIQLVSDRRIYKNEGKVIFIPMGLYNFESLPNGEIRNMHFPERELTPEHEDTYHLRTAQGLQVRVKGIDSRVLLDRNLSSYASEFGVVGEIKPLLYSRALMDSWRNRDFNGKLHRLKLSSKDIKFISADIPYDYRTLLEIDTNYCCKLDYDGLTDYVYNVYDAEEVMVTLLEEKDSATPVYWLKKIGFATSINGLCEYRVPVPYINALYAQLGII